VSRNNTVHQIPAAASSKRVKATLILSSLIIAGVLGGFYLRAGLAASTGKYFDYSVTILMENNDLQSVLSQGSFQASLASQYTLSTGYSAVSHPSEPNYSALISGQIGPNSPDGVCCGQDAHRNIVDSLESHGLTWKAYAEGLANGDCTGGGIDTDHFPFLYFSDIVNNPSRCSNLLGATAGSDAQLLTSLNAGSGWPNYIWLTPNNRNDAHDTSIAFGDSYLAGIVPKILSSTLFSTQKAALFIVYDEGNDVSCSSGGPDCVYASWSGPAAKKGFTSSNPYDHYSYVHTLEDNWALPTLTSNDAGAPVMAEFFNSSASLSISISPSPASPTVGQTVTFTATVSGGTPPYGVGWDFGDGGISVGVSTAHVFSTAGTFNVTAAVTDSATPAHTAVTYVFVTVSPVTAPDFQMFEAPASLTLTSGGSGSAIVSLASVGGFAGTVSLTDTVSPAGLSASFNATRVDLSAGGSASSELILLASSSTGSFTVQITGVSGSLTHSVTVSVIVTAVGSPGFSLSASRSLLKIGRGSSANLTITLTSLKGFSGNVGLSAASSIQGPLFSFNPGTVTLSSGQSANSTLTITIPGSAGQHNYRITITGNSGTLSNSTIVTVHTIKHSVMKVQGPQTIQPGQTVSFIVSATGSDPADIITLTASGLPSGATFDSSTGVFTWTPTHSQEGTHTVTFTAAHNGTPLSDYEFVTITVQGEAAPCILCIPHFSTFWLLVLGGAIGLFTVGAVEAIRARRAAKRARSQMYLLTN